MPVGVRKVHRPRPPSLRLTGSPTLPTLFADQHLGSALLSLFHGRARRPGRPRGDRREWEARCGRTTEGPLLEATFGPVEGGQSVTQAGRDGVVDLLGGEALGGVGKVAGLVGRVPVVLARGGGLAQELLHPSPFGSQQCPSTLLRPSSLLVPSSF